eukprot:SAG11_NODE_12975_length_676_cov_1.060659_2_plen_87_part_01
MTAGCSCWVGRTVRLRNGSDDRVVESPLPLPCEERSVRLDGDALGLEEVDGLLAEEEWVHLDLVDLPHTHNKSSRVSAGGGRGGAGR